MGGSGASIESHITAFSPRPKSSDKQKFENNGTKKSNFFMTDALLNSKAIGIVHETTDHVLCKHNGFSPMRNKKCSPSIFSGKEKLCN